MNWNHVERGSSEGSSEYGSKPSSSVNFLKILKKLNDLLILKEGLTS
jgi:hypothetical protein